MRSILVVDDSHLQLTYLGELLSDSGFRVLSADNGTTALTRLQRERIDLVISDILMPEMDGYELCRRIKAHPQGGIPVILLTRLDDPQDILDGLRCGADHFISKPFKSDALLQQIDALFRHTRERTPDRVRLGIQADFHDRQFTLFTDRERVIGLLTRLCDQASSSDRRRAVRIAEIGTPDSGLAHDFKNLLAVAGACDDHWQCRIRPGDLRETEIRVILESTGRSGAPAPLPAAGRDDLDINACLRTLLPTFRQTLGGDYSMAEAYAPDLPRVRMGRGAFEQVMANLMEDARDGLGEGGRIVLRTAVVNLDDIQGFPAARKGRHAQISVSRDGTAAGVGRQVITGSFLRAGRPARDGVSLSLAAAMAVAEQADAYLTTTAGPSQNQVVNLYLPEAAAPAEPPVEPAADTPPRERKVSSILVVEDEEQIGRMMKEILEFAGYQVTRVRNPQEALQTIPRLAAPPDLLITDVVLPGMSGPELARRLEERIPGMRILLVSGYGEWSTVHDQLIHPGTPFLQKPFSLATLTRKVSEILAAP